jgi:NAD(P)-dependent dehydrogenase (short-subunit alcohol dehydrogenase family)
MNLTGDSRRFGAALAVGAIVATAITARYGVFKKPEDDLSDEVVVITGGSSGLGFALAQAFGAEGCRIAICARDLDSLRTAGDKLRDRGIDALTIQCDVANRSEVEDLVRQTNNHFGRVDVLVNNAGVIDVGPAALMEHDDYARAMDIMFWGTVNPTLAVLPQMRERGSGRIVNITSIGGKVSVPHLLPYNTAKFAATGFSEGLHAELKRDGVHVTTIAPGLMRTGSFFNAEFRGRQTEEYVLFSLGSSLPVIKIDAKRAADQIVAATKRREAERVLSIPAQLLAKVHGVFPAATVGALGLANRILLPSADVRTERRSGDVIDAEIDSDIHDAVTVLGRSAAENLQPGRA